MPTQATITTTMSIKGFEFLLTTTFLKKTKKVHGILVIGEWEEMRQLQPKRMLICSQISNALH